jgi:hypothetical protein
MSISSLWYFYKTGVIPSLSEVVFSNTIAAPIIYPISFIFGLGKPNIPLSIVIFIYWVFCIALIWVVADTKKLSATIYLLIILGFSSLNSIGVYVTLSEF